MQRKSINDRRSIISILLGVALTLSEVGINSIYVVAQNLDQKIASTSASSADAILQKAERLFDQGQYQDALTQYQQGLNIYRQQGDRLGEAITLTWIGAVQIGLRQEKLALNTLLEANLILQRGLQNSTNSDKQLYRKAEGENQYQFGRAYLNLEEYANGLKILENSLSIRR
jgi:predicted negative regulator of RcsB-dependent stress response